MENLLAAWDCFVRGKRHKKDVIRFQLKLADNLIELHTALKNKTYRHGGYFAFNVSDPKPRNIHKVTVRDRVIHHLIYKELCPYFDSRFIYDSYSCRKGKGVHRALDRFKFFAGKISKNHTRTCYVLKCDVKKFFASIDQAVLMKILGRHIEDLEIQFLVHEVVSSFHAINPRVGLPLGNLTSQLLVNIYMHEFDMYLKQEIGVKYYIRYTDDFVILSDDKKYLGDLLLKLRDFLNKELHLNFHENKVYIKTYGSGVDFLGWVHFPHYRQIRTSTGLKIIRKLNGYPKPQTVSSYRGVLRHGDTYKIQKMAGILLGTEYRMLF
ncbi:MAG: reverse transcriptase/maturase family protein [bacterium]|nr:reverse transcriptase/maturase family protein [bacterium]